MACESILRGDCEMALAGGVNACCCPTFYVAFSQLGVLSPDGRCKTFDAPANGYVRAEGAGMVLLKPLSRCDSRQRSHLRRDSRHRAQPGRPYPRHDRSQPTGPGNVAARLPADSANINPADIQYVEAHGTGTPVGDPIEANALASVLGENRKPDQPCCLGSVKTNIGHLEAGAGIASLIKVALALHHKRIPAHLNFQSPNPQIDFEKLNLRLPLETEDWRSNAGPRLAGVNGFGYGGANAHVIVEEAPTTGAPKQQTASGQPELTAQVLKQVIYDASCRSNGNGHNNGHATSTPILLPISARSKQALADVASDLADWLDTDAAPASLAEIASFVAFRRSHQELRATVTGTRRDQWSEQLRAIAAAPESAIESTADMLNRLTKVCCSFVPARVRSGGRWVDSCTASARSFAIRSASAIANLPSTCPGRWSKNCIVTKHDSRMQKTSIAAAQHFCPANFARGSLGKPWHSSRRHCRPQCRRDRGGPFVGRVELAGCLLRCGAPGPHDGPGLFSRCDDCGGTFGGRGQTMDPRPGKSKSPWRRSTVRRP